MSYSRWVQSFRVYSPICTLRTAITHIIIILELQSLRCQFALEFMLGSAVPIL